MCKCIVIIVSILQNTFNLSESKKDCSRRIRPCRENSICTQGGSESCQMQKEWMYERLERYAILSGLVKIKHTSPNLLEKNWAFAEADGTGKVFVPWVRNSLCSSSSECSQPILS
jgi:hypothetical protein